MNLEDRSRLEEFRQFRREARGSREYLLVGIDVAKDRHAYRLYNPLLCGAQKFTRALFLTSFSSKLLRQEMGET